MAVPPEPRVPPESLAEHAAWTLATVGRALHRMIDAELAERFGLRYRHQSALKALVEGGPLSQQELGAWLRIDRATMVAIVDELEGRKLVARARDAADRRRYAVSITASGRRLVRHMDAALTEFDRRLLGTLEPELAAALHEAARKLYLVVPSPAYD